MKYSVPCVCSTLMAQQPGPPPAFFIQGCDPQFGMYIGPGPSGFRIVNLDTLDLPYVGLSNIPNQVTAAAK